MCSRRLNEGVLRWDRRGGLFSHGMRNEIPIFQANREKNEWERRTNMRKLWVKAWMTLDGVFDADTMDHWWPPADEAAVDEARRREYIVEEYKKGDVYPASTDHL